MTSTAMAMAEMEYTMAKTSVWWDIENCEVPRGFDSYAVAQNVSSALLKMKYCGPVSITAYGDTTLIPLHVQQALSSTGVGLNHVPAGVKDASDKKILVDMLLWAIDNPAPANFMLISGDRDFSYALHQLRMRRYNILLAQPLQASVPLVAAARNVWLWTSLASGGSPLTSAESSQLLNNGRCLNEVSKPIASTSGAVEKVRRNKLQNGRGVFGEFVDSRGTQASVSAIPIQEGEIVECKICQIFCSNREAYKKHTYGKRHQNNLELQLGKSNNSSVGPKDALDKQKTKVAENRAYPNGNYACRMCNVVCPSQIVFDSHLRGKKHASMLTQPEVIIDSKKWQEKGVSQNDQPEETIVIQKDHLKESIIEAKQNAEHVCRLCNVTCPSQIVFDSHLRGQKHAAMLSQSEALNNSKKVEEKVVQEKAEPAGAVAEPQSQFRNTQESIKFFEKQNEEFRGTSESSINEPCPDTKDRVETVNKQLPNGEFFLGDLRCGTEVQERESFDGIVKPVSLSEEAAENLEEVTVRRRASKLCNLCVVICDHQGLCTLVCGRKCHVTNKQHTTASVSVAINDSQSSISTKPIKEPEVVEPVWCQVCEIVCISKDAYKNHKYGKRHRNNWDLQSDKSNNMSVGPVFLPKEVLEKLKMTVNENRAYPNANHVCLLCNVVCQSQVVFDSHLRGKKHASMLSQPEALVNSTKPQEEGVCQKDQPNETIVSQQEQLEEKVAEPKANAKYVCRLCNVECPSQIVFDSHLRGQKHAAMLSQSELDKPPVNSKKLQEKDFAEQDQTRETIAQPKPKAEHVCRMCNVACHSPVVFDSHLRGKKHLAMLSQSGELIGSRNLQEKCVEENDQTRETIAEPQLQSPNAEETSKCFEKHVVMVNQSEALNNSMKLEEKVVTDAENQSQSQDTQEYINFFAKQNEELREIGGTSESSTREIFPSTEDQVDTINKQLPNGELAFGDLRCDVEVPTEASECFDGTVQESDLETPREALELQAFFVDLREIREEGSQEKETAEEHAHVKINDLGFRGAQEDKEEVKEINAISENLVRVFTEPSRDSRIPIESRGCLDLIPETVQLPPCVNGTEKLTDELKHKLLEPENESAGRKEHPGEAAKNEEESKGQVDNFWTRLWGIKR